ncbi:MAG: hypothetical protein DLM61_17395 [Pseudonocardiales bacterium]|nr:MAG: hypothetical protein DLM61_17395 [Pseudonocardiales bacterium]
MADQLCRRPVNRGPSFANASAPHRTCPRRRARPPCGAAGRQYVFSPVVALGCVRAGQLAARGG